MEERHTLWMRNVVDEFKDIPTEEIKQILKDKALPYAVCMEMLLGDFNLSTLIRNSNAFGAREVFYLGPKKHWDRRGACGTNHYTDVNYLKNNDELIELKKKYPVFIGIENTEDAILYDDFQWPENFIILFGEEGRGLSDDALKLCDHVVKINQVGSVRSVNVGTASGIIMSNIESKFRRNRV